MKLVAFLQLGLSTHREWTGTRRWDVGSCAWQSPGVNAEGLLSECGHTRQAVFTFGEPLEKIQHILLLVSEYTSLKISSPWKSNVLRVHEAQCGLGQPWLLSSPGVQSRSCHRPLVPPEPAPPPRNQPALYTL